MKLVPEARRAWKWFSMWAMGVPASCAGAWLIMPEKWQEVILAQIPPKHLAWALLAVLALGILGRLVQQEKKP